MPIYMYKTTTHLHECFFPMGKAPEKVLIEGQWAKRSIVAEHSGHHDTNGNYPMKCEASGVNPEQIGEARRLLSAHGTQADFTSDGRPIYTSAAHRKGCLKAFGLHDRNGGYGDP